MPEPKAPAAPVASPLYDTETGKRVDFGSAEDAHAALTSGRVAPLPGRVKVTLNDGRTGTVEGQDLPSVLQGGGHLASGEEYRAAELEKKYGFGEGSDLYPTSRKGLQHAMAAGGAAAFRGATLGLSDKVIIEAERLLHGPRGAEEARRTLAEMKEAHPSLSMANEIGGVAAASLAGPGAGALRGTPAALVGEVGHLVERGALELTAREGMGLGTRLASKAVSAGARGAIEGALYNAGDTYSESVLGDHELTAQKIYSALGMGALVGGTAGATFGVLGGGLSAAVEHLAPKMREAAGEQAIRALSPTRAMSMEMERRAGGSAAVGRTLLERGVIDREAGAFRALATAPEEFLPKVQAAKEVVGREIGEIIHGSPAYVPATKALGAFTGVVKDLEGKAFHESIASSIVEARTSFGRTLGLLDETGAVLPNKIGYQIPLEDFVAQRRNLDAIAYKESKALDPRLRVEFLRDVRARLSNLELEAIDRAADSWGGPRGKEVKALYREYQHLALAERAAERQAAAPAALRTASLTDTIVAGSALASGHPFAAPVVGLAHKFARERGNAAAAIALDKLANLGAVKKLSEGVSREVGASVEGFFSRPRRAASAYYKTRGTTEEEGTLLHRYREAVKTVTELQQDTSLPSRVQERSSGIASHAPQTATELSSVIARALSLLSQRLPNAPAHGPLVSKEVPRVPEQDMSRFLRSYTAAMDPKSVLQDLKRGKVTREGVEALKVTSPKLYAEVQSHVLAKLTSELAHGNVPYDKRLRLAVLFDVPADDSLKPDMIAKLQEPMAQAQGQAPAKTQGPRRPVKDIAKSLTTQGDRMEQANG